MNLSAKNSGKYTLYEVVSEYRAVVEMNDLLPLLSCPKCKSDLEEAAAGLMCRGCGRVYAVRRGIPSFMIEECLASSNRLQRILYTLYAPFYDTFEEKFARSVWTVKFTERELREAVVSSMDIKPGDTVLEVSVGTGGNIPFFMKYTDGMIIGLDITERMLDICREKIERFGWRNVRLVQGCAEHLPFKDAVFDRVLIGGGINYFSSPKRALEEMARVVKPGSKAVVYE
ncbi:MAG TPA: methyltransferase domain-containing protein [Candidatus Methanomethylia archaeon]|nr:methyltransferase domain-containing protein [Candidatus Methanomethylicia archaeon]